MASRKSKNSKSSKTAHVLNLITTPEQREAAQRQAEAEAAPEELAPAAAEAAGQTPAPEAAEPAPAPPARPLAPPIIEMARSQDEKIASQIRSALNDELALLAEEPDFTAPAPSPRKVGTSIPSDSGIAPAPEETLSALAAAALPDAALTESEAVAQTEELTELPPPEQPAEPVAEVPAVPAEEPAEPVAEAPAAPAEEPAEPVAEAPTAPAEEPAEPAAETPAVPAEEPAEPIAETPAAPAEEPAEPVTETPAALAEEPAEPVAETSAAPAEEPAEPVAETPAAPAEEPAEPVAEAPAAPAEEPAEPIAEVPAAPVEQPANVSRPTLSTTPPEPPRAFSRGPAPTPQSGSDLLYVNIMQTMVESMAPRYIKMFGVCKCARCAADVKALTLTNLRPRYAVFHRRERIPMLTVYENRYGSTIAAELTKACGIVKMNPHHF